MRSSPYAPPLTEVSDPQPANLSEVEELRRDHLRHEIQLKSVGALYYFSGTMLLLSAIVMWLSPEFSTGSGTSLVTFFVFYFGLSTLVLALGFGLRRLQSWVRIPTTVISAVGLIGFPIGTLINGWILYLLFCAKGRLVLSKPYQAVIAKTPHIKYKRSVGDWIATSILALFLLAVAVVIVVGARG